MADTELTTPHYPYDVAALACLGPERRTAFEEWMKRLDADHVKRGSPYGQGSLWRITGAECWLRPFLDGDEPEDALAEDLDNADYE